MDGMIPLQNKFRENATVFNRMSKSSGLLDPIMAGLAGSNLKQAQNRDIEIEGNYLSQMKSKQDLDEGKQLFDVILKVSESNPEEASNMLRSAAKSNAMIAKLGNIQFAAKTKDNWITVTDGTGQINMVWLPGLPKLSDPNISAEEKAKILVPVGKPKTKELKSVSEGTKLYDENKNAFVAENPKQEIHKDYAESMGDNMFIDMKWSNKEGKYVKTGKPYRKGNPNPGSENNGLSPKDFKSWITQKDTIESRIASIKKGIDPLTQQIIPQSQINDAIKPLLASLNQTNQYIQKTFPVEFSKYKIENINPSPNIPQGAVKVGVSKTGGKNVYQLPNGSYISE